MGAAGLVYLAAIVVCFGVIPALFLCLIDRLCRKDERS